VNDVFYRVLSLSAAASFVGILLILLKPLYKSRFGRTWQYYIWLIVLARLIIPYSPDIGMPDVFRAFKMDKMDNISPGGAPTTKNGEGVALGTDTATPKSDPQAYIPPPAADAGENPAETEPTAMQPPKNSRPKTSGVYGYLWVIWLVPAVLLLGMKSAIYLKYSRKLKKSAERVTDWRVLQTYAGVCQLAGVKRPPGIFANDAASPMLVGIVRPAIVFPRTYNWTDKSTELILKHELVHYMRKDVLLKWIVQIAACIHWFNPFVYLFNREISKNCELSCDDAVLDTLVAEERRSYGDALLSAVAPPRAYSAALMSSEGKLLKKRLEAVMEKKKKTKKHAVLSLVAAGAVLGLAILSGCATGAGANRPAFTYSPSIYNPTNTDSGLGKITDIYSNGLIFGAIDEDGKVYIWGDNSYGQCDIPALPPIVDMAIGAHCVIALGDDGKLYGWGTNEYSAMDFVGTEGTFISVSANACHTGAVSSDGRVHKWSTALQCGQKSVPGDLPPVVSIQCNTYTTSALDAEGNVYTWGIARDGYASRSAKAKMTAALGYDAVILDENGELHGDVKHENMNSRFKPRPDIENIRAIYDRLNNLAAIDGEGRVYIWGEYDYNPGYPSLVDVPENIPPMTKLALAYDTVVGLGTDGKLYQWGGRGTLLSECGKTPLNELGFEAAVVPDDKNGFLGTAPRYSLTYEKQAESAEVGSADEFMAALQNKIPTIYIKGNVDAGTPGGFGSFEGIVITKDQKLHILPGASLNVYTLNFNIQGDFANDGTVNVCGRMVFHKEPAGFGEINTQSGQWGRAEVVLVAEKMGAKEMKRLLNGELPVTSLYLSGKGTFVIDEDYTLPEGKSLEGNIYATLRIAKNATFTVNGTVRLHNKPIVEGTLVGDVDVYGNRGNG